MRISKLLGAITMATLVGAAHGVPTLIHDYQLNGTLADALGGPALVAAGGTLGGSGYTFAPNQGLSLSNGLAGGNGNYSIEMSFSFSNTGINAGYRKILDFKDRTSDNGLYALGAGLNFYNQTASIGSAFANNVNVDVVLTRDSGTNLVTGYLNGVSMWSFVDGGALAVFSGANDIVQFFKDDFNTGQTEASGGFADYIRIYDGALDSTQAQCVGTGGSVANCGIPSQGGNNVPEPGSLALIGAAALAAGLRRRRR